MDRARLDRLEIADLVDRAVNGDGGLLFQVLAFRLDLEVFFVLWLIGVLVVAEMVDATTVQPRQIRYLKYFIAVQIVIFGAIVAEKVLEILSS